MAWKYIPSRHRRTKIVATIGPATDSPESMRDLVAAGVDVARFNFSHGRVQDHERRIAMLRRIAEEMDRPVAIMQDLQGPKIRVGALSGRRPVHLREGSEVVIGTGAEAGTAQRLSTTYADIAKDIQAGDRIMLSDGAMELSVTGVAGGEVRARVVRGGLLEENKGINLPGVAISAPAMTAKDRDDLRLGLAMGVDLVALSFVRRPEDIAAARDEMERAGRSAPIVAKLEKAEAIERLDGIMAASDGVMVARGDLGVELAPERVPILQKQIIRRANEMGIPVITATQMLESMIEHPRPTRAEASDVANAILDGTDAVMLSAETAVGRYPIEAVRMMDRIAVEVEASSPHLYQAGRPGDRRPGIAEAVGAAACLLAHDLRARAIAVVTRSGRTAQLISKLRPAEPIVALTEDRAVVRALSLWWGVNAAATPFRDDTDAMVMQAEEEMVRRGIADPGDVVIITGSAPLIARGRTNFVKVHRIRRGK